MKRISETNDKKYDALKPLFGGRGGQAPFYDPNDRHTHVWHKGNLGNEDNPKSPTYTNAKLNIRKCVYCKICHKIRDEFQSSVGDNRDVVNGLESTLDLAVKINYNFLIPTAISGESGELFEEILKEHSIPQKHCVNERLFIKPEGVFNNYVKIETSQQL